MSDLYDIIIIGGGPAGLSAGIYATRAGYKTLLIEKMGFGGQMMLTDIIDNYPGFDEGVSGFELQDRMVKQVKKFGIEHIFADVNKVSKIDNEFCVCADDKIYKAMSVIIASGAKRRLLGIPGEKDFSSRGVSYCGTCDGPLFRNKDIVVVGGGDTAITEALFLSKFAKSMKVVHRKDRFRAVKSLVDQLSSKQNVEYIFNSNVVEIKGDDVVKSVIIENNNKERTEIQTEGVFVFVGLIPNSEFLDKELLDQDNYVTADITMQTNIKGIYAAGDIRTGAFRQIVCAASSGATAAEYAGKYVDDLKGVAYN